MDTEKNKGNDILIVAKVCTKWSKSLTVYYKKYVKNEVTGNHQFKLDTNMCETLPIQ